MRGERRARAPAGFTLIEVLSVVAILALMMALVIPNLSGIRDRALVGQAQRLADELELARQRAIVTGVPHRLWMDLDEAEFRLEWLAAPDPVSPEARLAALELEGNAPLALTPPQTRATEYQPVPGNFGRLQVVEFPFYFEAVETPEGRIERGRTQVVFDRDGTADATEIYVQDAEGRAVALDVSPLDERVRIRRDPE